MIVIITIISYVNANPKVSCFFIFGDSLADNGNNNNLNTLAKVNYKPYGIDFIDSQPTGRFTNGRTTVDIIGEFLGFEKLIPAFASLDNNSFNLLSGANYASGGAGILRQTGTHMELYNLGARMITLVGLGQIGCTPNAIQIYGTNNDSSSCISYMNDAVQLFNNKLTTLVDELNSDFTDAKFIYVNSYEIGLSEDLIALGFKVLNVGCCGGDENGQCKPLEIPCENRREYVFWDSFHPTEAYNLITATKIYQAYYNISYIVTQ
ncbi:hypothetical protein CsatB_002103 [Cannabis sativa]